MTKARDLADFAGKADTIETSATADQTAAEIRAAVEAATDSNVFTDADHTKLNAIEASSTGDQTAAQILTAIKTVDGAASALDADLLDGQHGSYYTGYADTAVSNLVDSSPASLNTLNELAAALGDDANFSTTVTNSIAAKLPLSGGAMTGAITTNSTFDGRDVAADGVTADAALPKAGGTISGNLVVSGNISGDTWYTGVGSQGILNTNTNDFAIKAQSNDTHVYMANNGAVTLYHDNAAKIATASGGVAVTGNLSIDAGNGNQLVLDNSGERFTQISFKNNSSQEAAIWYDATDNYLVAHANAGDGFQVQTGGSTPRLTIPSSGNVGIGTTDPGGSRLYLQDNHTNNVTNASTLIGNTTFSINGNSGEGSDVMRMGPMSNAGAYFIDVSNGGGSAAYPLIINPFSGGNLLQGTTSAGYPVYGDNFTVAGSTHAGMTIRSGTSNQGTLYFSDAVGTASGTYAGAVIYTHNNDKLALRAAGVDRVSISADGAHFAQGIFLGGTGAANKLDDVETGTWTPTILNGWGVTSPTFSTNEGFYVKVGSVVHISFKMVLSGGSTNGNALKLQGLPFNVSKVTHIGGHFAAASSNAENVFLGIAANEAHPSFLRQSNTTYESFTGTNAGSGFSLTFSGTYQT